MQRSRELAFSKTLAGTGLNSSRSARLRGRRLTGARTFYFNAASSTTLSPLRRAHSSPTSAAASSLTPTRRRSENSRDGRPHPPRALREKTPPLLPHRRRRVGCVRLVLQRWDCCARAVQRRQRSGRGGVEMVRSSSRELWRPRRRALRELCDLACKLASDCSPAKKPACIARTAIRCISQPRIGHYSYHLWRSVRENRLR